MADSYILLGSVAQDRGQLQEAEDWYRRSLAICEDLGNRPGMGPSYMLLGLLAEQRGQPREALQWMVRCVTLFEQFPHPAIDSALPHLARLTAPLGTGALETSWLEVTGSPLPQAVRDYINSSPPAAGQPR
jgi:hypothetical protein